MRMLPAEFSARWRSWVGSILDHGVELCFNAGHRLLALRERIAPTDTDLTPARADAILSGVLARIAEPPAFHPSDRDRAAARLASDLQRTVWIHPHASGRVMAAVESSAVHKEGRA